METKRSRSGKIGSPTEAVFNTLVENMFNGNYSNDNADTKFIPISVNYDRVLEGESFPLELLGEKP